MSSAAHLAVPMVGWKDVAMVAELAETSALKTAACSVVQ